MYFKNELWSAEELGNYVFGHTGAATGYSELFLCFGAGVYQIKSGPRDLGWYSTFFDDPRDTEMIRRGYRDYWFDKQCEED